MRVVLGVAGGIAAYKAVLLLRLLKEAGHSVRVVPTRAALEFVGRATWEALSGEPAATEVFEDAHEVPHVKIGQGAELVIVAPATADLLSRVATGRADDLLTSTLLTATCPVLLAPAMHTEMWLHAATQANVATLRERGVHVLDPAEGRLTGADSGPGRLPEPEEILAAARAIAPELGTAAHDAPRGSGTAAESGPLAARAGLPADDGAPLAGRHVVVSAGGTREPLDPVRFLGNRSSGRQGVAIAEVAARMGAHVTLVAANIAVPAPAGVEVVAVETTAELRAAVRGASADADVVVMAAAVADFRPASTAEHKIKKTGGGPAPIELVENPDILAELVRDRPHPGLLVVGFAAETGDERASVLEHGRAKALRKGADLLAVNDVSGGQGFGTETNTVTILDARGDEVAEPAGASVSGTKHEVAAHLLRVVAARLS